MQLAPLSCRDELSTVMAAAPPCFDDQLALDFAINVERASPNFSVPCPLHEAYFPGPFEELISEAPASTLGVAVTITMHAVTVCNSFSKSQKVSQSGVASRDSGVGLGSR